MLESHCFSFKYTIILLKIEIMIKRSILVLFVLASIGTSLNAQSKVATIDLQKVIQAFYKTKDADAKLAEAQKSYQDELNARMESYRKAVDAVNQANQDLNNANHPNERTRLTQSRDAQLNSARTLEREITDFRGAREKELQNERTIMRSNLVDEIRAIVNDQIRSEGYQLVLDSSGQGGNTGSPVVFFAQGGMDISDSVIEKLNANQNGISKAGPSPTVAQATKQK